MKKVAMLKWKYSLNSILMVVFSTIWLFCQPNHLFAMTFSNINKIQPHLGFDQSVKRVLNRGYVDVKLDFNAVGDGTINDTASVRDAAKMAATYDLPLHFSAGVYRLILQDGSPFITYINKSNVKIIGNKTTLLDTTRYTRDALSPIFLFDNCQNVSVEGIDYVGTSLVSPSAHLGYRGATFIRAINNCTNIKVIANIQHARYGVQTGEYADETKGGCKHFSLNLTTNFVGYPLAAYMAEDINANINAENVHRAAYLAGVVGGRINVQFKNQYIANVFVLITDAKSGPGRSRGSSNLTIEAKDMGSTQFQSSSTAVGINLSRVDPNTTFSNINIHFEIVGTDQIATKVGGFQMVSGASVFGYSHNWDPSIHMENINVSGTIDRSNQTIESSSAGEIYVVAHDAAIGATVKNLSFKNIKIIPSRGDIRPNVVEVPGLQNPIIFSHYYTPGLGLRIATNASIPAIFKNSVTGPITAGGTATVALEDSIADSIANIIATKIQPLPHTELDTGSISIKTIKVVFLLNQTTVILNNAIPAGCFLFGVNAQVKKTITGCSGYVIGISQSASQVAEHLKTLIGTGPILVKHSIEGIPRRYYAQSTPIFISPRDGNFKSGELELQIFYINMLQ